jgi:hypothetical protein
LGRDDLTDQGVPDAPSWWAEPGRAGFMPDMASGVAYPWILAGHVVGGWASDDPDLAELGPFPGIMTVHSPLGWLDSLSVRSGGEAGWDGFHGAFTQVHHHRLLPSDARIGKKAIADFTLEGGSNALDGNGLAVASGDSALWWRLGTVGWKRGGLGDLGPAGRHHYAFSGAWTRGRHQLSGDLAQAGSAAEMVTRESQSATGAGGSVRYGYALRGSQMGILLGRGYAHHESFGGVISSSRRDAHQRHAVVDWSRTGDALGLKLEVRDEWVTRVTTGGGEIPWTATSVWAAARGETRRGPARIESSVGAGKHDAGGTTWAPSARIELGERAWLTALHGERVVVPVWSDLAPGVNPFLQSTWKGGAEVAWHDPHRRVSAGWMMGRTLDRALLSRFPFEELWLRDGFQRDPDAFDFGLATASADWRWKHWLAHVEGFSLFRDDEAPQAKIDPRRGGRAVLETGFTAFKGDLRIRVRGDVAGMGGRQSVEPGGAWIEGDWTYGFAAVLNLADVAITLRYRNLEDKVRTLPWLVPLTGLEGEGVGDQFRIAISWRFFN